MPVSEHCAVAPKFSNGPWEATQNRHLQLFVCRAENHAEEICEVTSGCGADAQAIAALPELIEAAHKIFVVLDAWDGSEALSINYGDHEALRTALAKARGEV